MPRHWTQQAEGRLSRSQAANDLAAESIRQKHHLAQPATVPHGRNFESGLELLFVVFKTPMDKHGIAADLINHPMLFGNPAAPEAVQAILQGFGLANAREWVSRDSS